MKFLMRRLPLGSAGWIVVLAWCGLAGSAAVACPYSIRDSAFIGRGSHGQYRVLFVVQGDTPERDQLSASIKLGAEVWLSDSNVVTQVVDLNELQRLDASLRSELAEPGELPAAILVSPEGTAMRIAELDAANRSQDAVMDALVTVIESPARLQLREHIVEAWCVLVLVEGDDPGENERAKQAFAAAAAKITGSMTEMGKVVTTGPYLLTVSPEDPAEQVFLWSLGFDTRRSGDLSVRTAMILGRGQRRGPVLEAGEVTEENLFDSFQMLGRSCSCTTSEVWLFGSSIPMDWGADIQALAQDQLGFDPNDPNVLTAIGSALAGGGGSVSGSTAFDQTALGYRESLLPTAATRQGAAGAGPAVTTGAMAPQGSSPLATATLDVVSVPARRSWLNVLAIMAGTGILALALGTVWILRRAHSAG